MKFFRLTDANGNYTEICIFKDQYEAYLAGDNSASSEIANLLEVAFSHLIRGAE